MFYAEDRLTLLRGDAANLPLPDNSVDLIVTSPPYFGLRSYKDGGEHYSGQVGAEATPAEFVAALVACTREWVRVLKPTGSLWVNLGDKYAGSGAGPGQAGFTKDGSNKKHQYGRDKQGAMPLTDVRTKSLIGVPWRYALACIDDLGLILRAEVIWDKPNGLPESVRDRVRRSHEQWFHFTLSPRYYSAVDEIREPHTTPCERRKGGQAFPPEGRHSAANGGGHNAGNPLGRLPGSVWRVASQPLRVPAELGIDHFAAFPMEWPRRIISGWAPTRGICIECGQGVTSVSSSTVIKDRGGRNFNVMSGSSGKALGMERVYWITGYECGCPHGPGDTTPAVVLDPFGGTGTTALVAWTLGCHGVSNDLSADYCRLARWRTTDPKQRERAARPAKPLQ